MYYSNKEADIYYKIIGEGKPLLILHGFSIDHRGLQGILEESTSLKTKYKRIYIDLPGMGKSNVHNKDMNADNLLTILIEFVHKVIGERSFSILGYSYGGYLALGLIKKLPTKIKKAVLLAPVVKAENSSRTLPEKHVNKVESFDVDNQLVFEQYKHAVVNITEASYKNYLTEIQPGLSVGDQEFQKSFQRDGYKLAFEERLLLNDATCERLIILGKQDDVVGYEDVTKHRKKLLNSRIILLDNAGHNLQLDERDVIRKELSIFLT
ncbi:alpha/beta fold hydrolase [Candidatus Enterococcus mansonii]|uniref:AB hydrolase-1 domain-containing protein n=1 Tax=Candidatus Enterococcus mansonii TaxID=1834181 RepID=A0A242CK31_9ENTE|nr:alpha/beta hydrolase [Enterococcus sp. 4G2_DIV0659]OTO10468.1 hypothetical protein A5880_001152 [Enterococcus sp. 4G2_DIV0659]